jgi:4'-phosphopantetheinyl transferase
MTTKTQGIDVWYADPDALTTSDQAVLYTLLDLEEQNRFASLRRPSAKRQYLLAHVLLRVLASRRLGVHARDIVFEREKGRKPKIVWPDDTVIDFSISHTEGMVACALMFNGKIGIDVEYRAGTIDTAQIARACLTEDEQEHLASLEHEDRRDVFFDLWTIKEAYLKGMGTGLGISPREVGVEADSLMHDHLRVVTRNNTISDSWMFRKLLLDRRHSGALVFHAADGRDPSIEMRSISVNALRTSEEILSSGVADNEAKQFQYLYA